MAMAAPASGTVMMSGLVRGVRLQRTHRLLAANRFIVMRGGRRKNQFFTRSAANRADRLSGVDPMGCFKLLTAFRASVIISWHIF